jgi:hypothetical protein
MVTDFRTHDCKILRCQLGQGNFHNGISNLEQLNIGTPSALEQGEDYRQRCRFIGGAARVL